jgi:hypothetical protein
LGQSAANVPRAKRNKPSVVKVPSPWNSKKHAESVAPIIAAGNDNESGAQSQEDDAIEYLVSPTGFLVKSPDLSGKLIIFEPDDYMMQPSHKNVSQPVIHLDTAPRGRAPRGRVGLPVNVASDPFVKLKLHELEPRFLGKGRREETLDMSLMEALQLLNDTAVAAGNSLGG